MLTTQERGTLLRLQREILAAEQRASAVTATELHHWAEQLHDLRCLTAPSIIDGTEERDAHGDKLDEMGAAIAYVRAELARREEPVADEVAMEAWRAAVNDASELFGNAPDKRFEVRAARVLTYLNCQPPAATATKGDVPSAHPEGWVSVAERLPKSTWPVLAVAHDQYGKARVLRAMYAAENTLELADEQDSWPGCTELDEQWYCEPGWYERNENEETNWRISEYVSHWMPLPTPPAAEPPSSEHCGFSDNTCHCADECKIDGGYLR